MQPNNDQYQPPAGPPPGYQQQYQPPPGPPPPRQYAAPARNDDYAPPPGPPPSAAAGSRNDDLNYIAPPPGPPPSAGKRDDLSYIAPPPGSPPSAGKRDDLSYIAPPPGPPPQQDTKSQHNWQTVVPDTSLFPPPPSFFAGWYRSPATNAPEEEAEAGEKWCAQHPLLAPTTLDASALAALSAHNPRLMEPAVGFCGQLAWTAPGRWTLQTDAKAPDSCIIGYPPLYAVTAHSPLRDARPRTVYYEVVVRPAPPRAGSNNPFHRPPASANDEVCLALGFTALPYPSFRMPGWHRGSLAVHGDDGHKFINDRWGGQSFTEPFRRGETYGIGMTFSVPGGVAAGGRIETEVFFTRGGREVGRWNLHEEADAEENLPVTGLEGYHDLSCAVGTYGAVDCEVVFDPARWAFRPAGC